MIMFNKKSWVRFFFPLITLYILLCLFIYCISVNINVYEGFIDDGGKISYEFISKSMTIAEFWSIKTGPLHGYEFSLVIFLVGLFLFLIDCFLTRRIIYRFTKKYKQEIQELEDKKRQELEEKEREKNKKTKEENISVKVTLPDQIDKPIKKFMDIFKKHVEINDGAGEDNNNKEQTEK